jgi:hypothetical protein
MDPSDTIKHEEQIVDQPFYFSKWKLYVAFDAATINVSSIRTAEQKQPKLTTTGSTNTPKSFTARCQKLDGERKFCLNESAEREVGSPDEWKRRPPPAGRCGWRRAAGMDGDAMVPLGRRRVVGAGEMG